MKILYIDDQGTDSLKLDLEKYGFDVETSDGKRPKTDLVI